MEIVDQVNSADTRQDSLLELAILSPHIPSKDLRFMHLILCVSFAATLLGCAPRSVRISDQPATAPLPAPPDLAPERADSSPTLPFSAVSWDSDYIDLRPGWRLRVITPLLKSEGYRLQVTDEQTSGNTVTFSAGEDFEGYETAFYAVEPQEGGGVQVEFVSAEVTKEGEPVQQPHPQAPLCRLPPSARFVRLIYLKRLSRADHDMAVVAADTMGALNTLTREVQTRQSACKSDDRSFCSWIPVGIAVRPEVRRTVGSADFWEPAR